MYIIGIDPGLTGAIAVYSTESMRFEAIYDMPVIDVIVSKKKRKDYDIWGIWKLISKLVESARGKCVIVIERQLPGSSGSSNKKFNSGGMASFSKGFGYALLLMAVTLAGVTPVIVLPRKWKDSLPEEVDRSDKNQIRQHAIDEFSELTTLLKRVKDHNRAEAALIAAYGVKTCR